MAGKQKDQAERGIQVTLRQLVLLGLMAFTGMGAMFVLGLLVGRGMSPLDFRDEIVSIHQEIAGLRKSVARGDSPPVQDEQDFDIYEYLKKDDDDLMFNPQAKDPTKDLLAMALAGDDTRTTAGEEGETKPGSQAVQKKVPAGWAIQVAAVTIEKDALRAREKYRKMGYPVYITFLKRPDKPVYFRIRVGPYPVKEDASRVHAELQKKKRDCYMLYEDGQAPMVLSAGQESIPQAPGETGETSIRDLGPEPEAEGGPGVVEELPDGA